MKTAVTVVFAPWLAGAILSVTVNLVAPHLGAQDNPELTRLLRFPDVHGNTAVFCYAGDLWRADISGGNAVRLTSHPGLELFPRISPDGRSVAFTGQIDGDEQVYVIPLSGGEPRQLTFYPANGPLPERWGYDHQVQGWTPDGRGVVFRSLRESWTLASPRLFVASVDGGLPVALPMPTAGSGDFSPDGRRMVYSPLFRDFRAWKRYEGGWAQDLWIFDPDTLQATNITDHPRTDRDPMWVGDQIYFASDREGTLNLFRFDPNTGETTQETLSETWDVRWPARGGPGERTIIFEQGGLLVLFDIDTKDQQPLRIRVPDEGLAQRPHRMDVGGEIADAALSPTGKRALFAAHGDIFTAPVEHGPVRNLTNSPGAHDREPVWSPDGQWIAFLSDQSGEEQVWVTPQSGSTPAKPITEGLAVRLHSPRWSPSSDYLSFGDKDGVLRIVEVATGRTTQVADESRGTIDDASWYPVTNEELTDRYLAFSMTTETGLSAVHVWDRSTGETHRVTPPYGNDHSPTWSLDGKRLFYLGARSWSPRVGDLEWDYTIDRQMGAFALTLATGTGPLLPPRSDEAIGGPADGAQDDTEAAAAPSTLARNSTLGPIEFDGMADRVEQLPLPLENWRGIVALDGALLAMRSPGFYYGRDSDGDTTLVRFDFESRKSKDLASDIRGVSVSPDRGTLLIQTGGGFARMPADGGDQTTVDTTGTLFVDRVPSDEWRQIFGEVWRRFRDYFYADNMHGQDWEALRQQYESLLPHVRHRVDLNYLISEMIGELNVGHAYISGGKWTQPDRPTVALPGATFRFDSDTGRFHIDTILPGDPSDPRYRSPLTAIGVRAQEGHFVLAIDGEDLGPGDNPYQLLRHKGPHPVTLTLSAKSDGSEPWEASFVPVTQERNLHYQAWVAGRRAAVAERSNGKLGYLHVPDMGGTGLREFIKWFYPQRHLDGLVIDVRGNGGGNISQMLIERLSRKVLMGTFGRTTGYRPYPQATYEGHLACLLNENSASDGDIFPAMFRRAGLGPLIGKRSWGGIIGITNRGNLIDGGVVNVPEFGNTELDGEWTIEGKGVVPDVVVDNPPAALLRGADPQLETAVDMLLETIAKTPINRGPRPPNPIR